MLGNQSHAAAFTGDYQPIREADFEEIHNTGFRGCRRRFVRGDAGDGAE